MDECVALSTELGFAHWLATGKILQGWAIAEQGQLKDGIAIMQEGITAWQAIGAEVAAPHCLAMLAGAFLKSGQYQEGLAKIEEAFSYVKKNGEQFYVPELYRLKGEMLLAENQAEAEVCFRQAITIAQKQKTPSFELRAQINLGHLLKRKGDSDAARKGLIKKYDKLSEKIETRDLQAAKQLMNELHES